MVSRAMERRFRTSIVLGLLTLTLVLGGCGGSSTQDDETTTATGYEKVFAAVRGLHGTKRTAKLASLAKREGGKLTVYTSINSEAAGKLADEFEDAYGIEVAFYRGSTEVIAERLLQEARADFQGADVAGLDGLELFNLDQLSLLVDYTPDGVSRLVPGADRDGWTVSEFATFVVSWNTNRVPEGEQPRSWEDLADPRWRGRLAMESSDFEWYGTLRDYWVTEGGKSEAEADRLFEQMARNAKALSGHTLMTQLLAAGEFDVAATTFASGVDQLRNEGASISRTPAVEPVVVRTNGVALVRQARHPATAALYLEWLVADGQELILELGREPARRDLATTSGVSRIYEDYTKLVRHQKEWIADYERVLRNAK
jgi:iron(III) transport system substrate-binding protein